MLGSSRGASSWPSWPKSIEAARARTAPLLAKIPNVSKVGANGFTPATEINPCDGRRPQVPQLLAGTRTDPPVSVPSAKSTRPQATADADPLEDPQGPGRVLSD